jgi:NADPH-dependent stearoyl-CoA 9-desaturase
MNFEEFGRELDELYARTKADLGQRDVQYIRRVIRWQRGFEIAGRALLFVPTPATWALGTASLATSKIIENMEVGHNVMHGQYDFANDPKLSGATYEWDNVCPSDQWRHSHNVQHHTFTNVREVDHDLGYRMLRVEDRQPWRWWTTFQPLYAGALALFFQWGVATHDIGPENFLHEREKWRGIGRKAGRQLLKDYVLFPLLAGPNALAVIAGNAIANLARNVWSFSVIFCGHFPDGTVTFPADVLENESRGAWYYRQILGSANFDGGWLMHFMSGHLSHQIEHHLFPDIPAHRYPEMAREVKAICERHGVAYNTGSFAKQIWSVVKKIFRLALPSRGLHELHEVALSRAE